MQDPKNMRGEVPPIFENSVESQIIMLASSNIQSEEDRMKINAGAMCSETSQDDVDQKIDRGLQTESEA